MFNSHLELNFDLLPELHLCGVLVLDLHVVLPLLLELHPDLFLDLFNNGEDVDLPRRRNESASPLLRKLPFVILVYMDKCLDDIDPCLRGPCLLRLMVSVVCGAHHGRLAP